MHYQYGVSYAADENLLALLPGLFSGIPSFALSIATYVLSAMALYAIAKRRGINHPWLSWIPVANVWVLGSLSDQYRYVVKGEIKSKRKSLLVLSILMALLTAVIAVIGIVMVVQIVKAAVLGGDPEAVMLDMVGPLLGIAGVSLPLAGVVIARLIIRYMALYDLYTSCDPGNNVLFLVLSILFRFTEPFFLFFSRGKDEGMPPRRQEPVYNAYEYTEPQWQPPQPNPEPWDTENKDYL